MDLPVLADHLRLIYIISVWTLDVVKKTFQEQGMIGMQIIYSPFYVNIYFFMIYN